MNDALRTALKQLRLSGLLESLDVRLQEAAGHSLNHVEFLELILQDELVVRSDRLLKRRVKAANFRELKTLDDFDWSFNPSIKKKQIYDLASGRFIREARDVLWLGPPGVGKSHLVQAVGYQALKAGFVVLYRSIFDVVRDFLQDEALAGTDKVLARYLKPDLLIIDDMGMKQLPKRSGEYLFEIIMRRYETRSTMMTSNRPLEDWGKLVGDVPSATAILDRFLHHAEIITITGKSYRLRNQARSDKEGEAESKPAKAPSGSEEIPVEAKPAKAPLGSERRESSSKPAKAPVGSEGGPEKVKASD
jgi:DNA replication protein DnaC